MRAGYDTSVTPPETRQVLTERTHHGDTVVDPYAWLADVDDPAVLAHLVRENDYVEAMTGHLDELRDRIGAELESRARGSDGSVPFRKNGWWYYTRGAEGGQYALHCRVAADGEEPPNLDGPPPPGEEILLAGDAEAGDSAYFAIGAFEVSPDGRRLAYAVDSTGDERFRLRIKDLTTGRITEEIPGACHSCAWSADGRTLFYVTLDALSRPSRVWRHQLGTSVSDDVVVFSEPDETFWVCVELTRSERFVAVSTSSSTTSEVHVLDVGDPTGPLSVVRPRRDGVEYSVQDWGEHFVILHNDHAPDFEVAVAPITAPGDWEPLIRHQEGVRIAGVDAYHGHLVVEVRHEGLSKVLIYSGSRSVELAFPEPAYALSVWSNPEYHADRFWLHYSSMVTPPTVYECRLQTGAMTVLEQNAVPGWDAHRYQQHRVWAIADDGVRVPISLVCRAGMVRDGSAPCKLFGYGGYGTAVDATFSPARLSLLDRGFVVAIAHVRGGGELGSGWHSAGSRLAKKNSFADFLACAHHLIAEGWTSAGRIVAEGQSAGGLLVGAAVNMAPHLFAGVIASMPFVDALTTGLDPSQPLTPVEWEEWGDPLHDADAYAYIKSYSPYDNIQASAYPPILAVAGLNDSRVSCAEAAKWIARLRATATGGPFLLATRMNAGHLGPSGRHDAHRARAFELAWTIDVAS